MKSVELAVIVVRVARALCLSSTTVQNAQNEYLNINNLKSKIAQKKLGSAKQKETALSANISR